MYACLHIPKAGLSFRDALLALGRMFSPQVEAADDATIVISIAGLRRLMGGPHQIASELARRGQERGMTGNIAIAANPDTAILGARNLRGVTVIEPGKELDHLGPLPLRALPLEEEALDVLRRWGIRTLDEFCALPESGVLERLGKAGLVLLKLARGAVHRPLRSIAEEVPYRERLELEYPVALLEPLLFLIARLLNPQCARLKQNSLATTEIRLGLELEDKSEHERILQLPFATHDAKALLKLLELDLSAHPPREAVTAMTVTLRPVEPRIVQNSLYTPPAPEPEKLELTLSKIRGLVGQENAGSPQLIDTYRPDAWRMRAAPPGRQTLVATEDRETGVVRMAFRYFRPARAARVALRNGVPCAVSALGVAGRIEMSAGPWRASGDWWSEAAWARQEWDIRLDDGAMYRLVETPPAWALEGSYD